MISVVICTYNGEKYIGAQIESILAQTLLPAEIVVGDDGSADNTLQKVEYLRSRIEEKGIRLTIYHNKHLGAHGNFKTTLPKAIGEWIAPCDQDDIWLPEKLEKCAKAMKDGVDVVYCDEYIMHENGNITENNIKKPGSVLDQLFGTHLAGHLLLFRREMLDVYCVAPDITFDYGITIAAACRNSIAHVKEKLCYWRRHDFVVTTSMSNHNPYKVIHKNKWSKWFSAMLTAFIGGGKSIPIADRYQSISCVVSEFAKRDANKIDILHLCNCMKKQTVGSLILAGYYLVKLRVQTPYFHALSFKDKIANIMYNFTYPAGWWYEYRVHNSL